MSWITFVTTQAAPVTTSLWEKALPSLIGSFCGTSFAFLLATLQRWVERRAKRYAAVIDVQSILMSQAITLTQFAKHVGLPSSANPFDTLAKLLIPFPERTIDYSQISYLALTNDPHLLTLLQYADQEFRRFQKLIETRNDLATEIVDEETQIAQEPTEADKAARRAKFIKRRLFDELNEATKALMYNVANHNHGVRLELIKFIKKTFWRARPIPSGTIDLTRDFKQP